MNNKLFSLVAIITAMLISFSGAALANAEDTKSQLLCDPLGLGNCQAASEVEQRTGTMIGNVITYALWGVGAIAVIFLIYGGLTFAMSSGDAEKVKKAKAIILYSLIGFGLALLANIIIGLVSSTVLKFYG
jgi:hypothetical protein